MAVNVKMGVDIGAFKSGIREGQQILKSLNAEMKATDAEFKATGNAEKALADKTKNLNSQLNVQKGIIDKTTKALEQMEKAGVDPTDKSYQQLYATLMNAKAGMYETQAALMNLDASQLKAVNSANELCTSVSSIGKKISLDQVIGGIDKVTGAMESAAKTALRFGEQIWDSIMDSARWGDDVATQAAMAQMSVEEYQRVMFVAATQGETSTNSLIKSWKKVKMNLTSDSEEVISAFKELGITTTEWFQDDSSGILKAGTRAKDYMDVYWEIGEALMNMTDAAKQERLAQTLLGRSWEESIPMFKLGREEYERLKAAQDVNDQETIQNLSELADKITTVENQLTAFKNTVWGELATAFTEVADTVSGLLHEVNTYLQTEEGQATLQEMGDAVKDLFSGIKDISAEDIVNGFKDVFGTVVGSLQWVVDNKDTVVAALEAVVIGWGALELTGGALQIVKLVDGIAGLAGAGAAEAGAAAGASWGSAFAGAVLKAAPWLAGLVAMLTPSGGDEQWDTLVDTNGKVTEAGKAEGITQEEVDIANAVKEGVTAGIAQSESSKTTKSGAKVIDLTYDTMIPMIADNLNGGFTLHLDADKLSEEWQGLFGGGNKENEPELPVKPELPADAQQQIQNAMDSWNPMKIYVKPILEPQGAFVQGHANGLPWVPYDGYLAMLHRGERVLTASENKNYTYYNNTYMGGINLNNGMELDALMDSIDRSNRRRSKGFGS